MMMQIHFSRHAKRRARLYNIAESKIVDILNDKELSQGEHEIIEKITGIVYSVKIVVRVEDDIITVITSYPLKKGRSK
jgi:hypothetical protein